ncbi:methyltransferase domain-containing protein [Ornithinibacillus sp. BX22]|uniref:Methyltransferase domain-containing protein n=1 Tax=Ornithinibacillus hominis TaxID=2763055 RepID=A0A923RFY1_9BACI|nr:methyltransferase domain-containing protein [Ornithinibacillus hominis]MBC5635719.1 methyltransferase domain-containing protein [Ornithinibacillus hominis]
MKIPIDRIAEAYFDQMGTSFGKKTRKRIHWICENALGEQILDVGCSQGITSILLGREGKKVIGIDLLKDSIDYAKEMLTGEAEVTKQHVEFINGNFIDYDFKQKKFDSVIFGEVLEHLTDPKRFVRKAYDILAENGQMIITVPFGINDYFDHKKTYYLYELLELQMDLFSIKQIEFFGKWIGIVLTKGSKENLKIDLELLKRLELTFYEIERNYIEELNVKRESLDKLKDVRLLNKQLEKKILDSGKREEKQLIEINKLNIKISELETEIKETTKVKNENILLNEELNRLKESLDIQNTKVDESKNENKEIIESLSMELESHKKEISRLEEDRKATQNKLEIQKKDYEQQVLRLKNENTETKKLLLEAYEKEEKLLKNHSKLTKINKRLEESLNNSEQNYLNEKRMKINSDKLLLEAYSKEERLLNSYSTLLKRYDALKNSKLGNLTIGYWKWRKKRIRR